MKRQTSVPSKTDKYYLKKGYGGYNPCVLGNKKHRYCKGSVLVNCVGYVTGRYNFVANFSTPDVKKCQSLGNTNAENYWALAKKQGLERGQTPRPGSVMVWEGKGSKAGHVAMVEAVLTDSKVETSESGWGYTKAYVSFKTRKKNTGNWGLDSTYKFLGFVYNPNIEPYPNPTAAVLKEGDKGESVKWLQWAICRAGYSVDIDGSFGPKTKAALKKAQKVWGIAQDGTCGPITQSKIKELYTIE